MIFHGEWTRASIKNLNIVAKFPKTQSNLTSIQTIQYNSKRFQFETSSNKSQAIFQYKNKEPFPNIRWVLMGKWRPPYGGRRVTCLRPSSTMGPQGRHGAPRFGREISPGRRPCELRPLLISRRQLNASALFYRYCFSSISLWNGVV